MPTPRCAPLPAVDGLRQNFGVRHVCCSFLALVLVDELQRRLATRGRKHEWRAIRQDLEALSEVQVRDGYQWYLLRTALQGVAGKVLQAVGAAIPPSVRPVPFASPW